MSVHGLGQPYGFGLSFQRTDRPAKPAAGAIFTRTLDSRYRHRLVEIVFTLATSAVAGNRYVTVEYEGGDGNPVWINAAAVTVSANSTQRFVGSVDRTTSEWNTNTDVLFPLSRMFLDGGGALEINVASIDVADQLSLIYITFDLFPTDEERNPGLEPL